MLEKLLDDVVAEDILHQLNRIWFDLPEDDILLVTVRCLELGLDETRPMLVTAEFYHVAKEVPELTLAVLIVPKFLQSLAS